MRLPGPDFPILCRRLDRKHLSPDPFWKKMARVPRPAKTSEIFPAPGHDLSFPSRDQTFIGKICCHTHFGKSVRRRHSLSAQVHFCSLWQGLHFSRLSSKIGREVLSPHPFLEKRIPDPQLTLKNDFSCVQDKILICPSCDQDFAESLCLHIHFSKKRPRCRSLPRHVRFL